MGARFDDDAGSDSGSAYIFTRGADGSWSQTSKLTAADAAADDDFGHSVSISGNTAIVGALANDDPSTESGSAYIFTRGAEGTWRQTSKLTAADGAGDDGFGYSVFIQRTPPLWGRMATMIYAPMSKLLISLTSQQSPNATPRETKRAIATAKTALMVPIVRSDRCAGDGLLQDAEACEDGNTDSVMAVMDCVALSSHA